MLSKCPDCNSSRVDALHELVVFESNYYGEKKIFGICECQDCGKAWLE
jgi:uncharacterized protein with PIN domain